MQFLISKICSNTLVEFSDYLNSVLAKRYELLDELIYWNYGMKLERNKSVSLNLCNA